MMTLYKYLTFEEREKSFTKLFLEADSWIFM